MKLTTRFTVTVLLSGLLAVGGCDFGGDDDKDTGGVADVQETDTSIQEDTNVGTDTNAGVDTSTGTVTAATCREIVTIADLNANLTSDLGGGTWAWLATVQETGSYDAGTSTQYYAVCAEVFRCESGMWGQLEVMIFAADEAPPWLNAVRGATTQLTGIGSEAWEYPIQYGVVFWKGDYAVCLSARSGFNKSWTQAEIDAYAAVVADKL